MSEEDLCREQRKMRTVYPLFSLLVGLAAEELTEVTIKRKTHTNISPEQQTLLLSTGRSGQYLLTFFLFSGVLPDLPFEAKCFSCQMSKHINQHRSPDNAFASGKASSNGFFNIEFYASK